MNRRTWLVTGFVTVALGGGAVAGVIAIDLPAWTLPAAGFATLWAALYVQYVRSRRGRATRTPAPERRGRAAPPGETLADALVQFRTEGWGKAITGDRLAEDLREAAITAMIHFEGHSRERAEARIEDGSWTSDPQAAAFLGPDDPPEPTLRERLMAGVGFSGPTDDGDGDGDVRRTVAAIASIGDAHDAAPPTESDDPTDDRPVRTIAAGDDRRRSNDTVGESRATNHWQGIDLATMLVLGIGLLAKSPATLLVGAIGLAYVGVSKTGSNSPPELSIDRTVSETNPTDGEEIDVTVTVRNESDRLLPALHIVDGVPYGVSVTDGSPRSGTTLEAGGETSFTYRVRAETGVHEFDPALITVRTLTRSRERDCLLDDETTLTVEPRFEPAPAPVPLRTQAASFAGRMPTREGGSGVELHSVREYRRGDPIGRIDWNRHARTGELATLQFREERAVSVVVLIDARRAAYLAPPDGDGHAVDRAIRGGERIVARLLEDDDSVGVAAIGPHYGGSPDRAEPCWLSPGTGDHHRSQLRRLLTSHPQFDARPPTFEVHWQRQLRGLERQFPADSQVVFLSPLADGVAVGIARWLDAHGHPVTIVSPDPTGAETAGQQLARVGRRVHVADVESAGIPLVDWGWDEPIETALTRAARRGDR